MTTTDTTTLPPNHHAGQGSFSGPKGLLVASSMRLRRRATDELAAELVALRPGDTVVDIGCGPGTAAQRAARAGATVIGIDPSPLMLRVARATGRGARVRWEEGTAERLPLDDCSADAAWTLASVHHWTDLDASVREVRRVLRPGGRFLAAERAVSMEGTGLESHGWIREQAEAFADLCRNAGFVDAHVERHQVRHQHLLVVRADRPQT